MKHHAELMWDLTPQERSTLAMARLEARAKPYVRVEFVQIRDTADRLATWVTTYRVPSRGAGLAWARTDTREPGWRPSVGSG